MLQVSSWRYLLRCVLILWFLTAVDADVEVKVLWRYNVKNISNASQHTPQEEKENMVEGLRTGHTPFPKFYHKSMAVRRLVTELASPGPGHCPGLELVRAVFPIVAHRAERPVRIKELHSEAAWNYTPGPHESVLDIVRISRRTAIPPQRQPPVRYAFFFGEHGRELISTEVGIYLMKAFCGREDVDARVRHRALQVLSSAEVMILPNLDEGGRRYAEEGHYCQRQNLDHVDLNRNWDYRWAESRFNDQGPYPFSEPETQIARKYLEAFKPDAFLSVHSGDRALWTPGAYDFDDGEARRQKGPVWETLLAIADKVNEYTRCNCRIGAPGKVAHLRHPGTSLDYAGLKMNIPFAMAWEIWLHQTEDCFPHYNPTSMEAYSKVQERWGAAMVYFAETVAGVMQERDPVDTVRWIPPADAHTRLHVAEVARHRLKVHAKHARFRHDGGSAATRQVPLHSQRLRSHLSVLLCSAALLLVVVACAGIAIRCDGFGRELGKVSWWPSKTSTI